MFDRDVFFDYVRNDPFPGSLDQGQVEGMEAILSVWERYLAECDLRCLAYMLATTMHETASTMLPIEEYGKGQGMSYGVPDPETGQTYYGRGFVQLTWRDNYARADREIAEQFKGIDVGMEYDAALALKPRVAAAVMFLGMGEGWFRSSDDGGPENLARYFNEDEDDPYEAREIINGDKTKVPSWSNGVSIGNLIAGYHADFLAALESAWVEPAPGRST